MIKPNWKAAFSLYWMLRIKMLKSRPTWQLIIVFICNYKFQLDYKRIDTQIILKDVYELVTLYNNQIDPLICKSRESIVAKILWSTIQYAIHKSMNMMILMINRSKSILVFHLEGIELERLANGVGCESLRDWERSKSLP